MNAITRPPLTAPVRVTAESSPAYKAEDLLKSSSTAQIVLGESIYTLRLTRAGKLILTK